MRLSHFIFIIVCTILYSFRSDVFNPFATEITTFGSDCPGNITGMPNFTLPELNGLYSVAAFYTNSLIPDQCYKIRFTPINDNRNDMHVGFLSGVGIPIYFGLRLLAGNENGTFQMRDSVTGGLLLGQAYILSNDSSYITYYSCRQGLRGLLKFHTEDVLVLTRNATPIWTNQIQSTVTQTLQNLGLNYGYLKPVFQGRETCSIIGV